MSSCRFIASNMPLAEFAPSQEYPVKIDIDKGTIDDGGAKQIIDYIKNVLLKSESVEFWLVWLMDYYEYEDRPFVHRKTISIGDLTIDHIKEIDSADIWNTPDKMSPERPSFYCLTVTR